MVLYTKINEKSSDLFKFYLKNKYFSILSSLIYIAFFIVILYVLRLYNLNTIIDLKVIYHKIYPSLTAISELSILAIIFIVITFLLFLLFLILLLLLIHKYFYKHIHMLYIYYRYAGDKARRHKFNRIWHKIAQPYNKDLISYFIDHGIYTLFKFINKNFTYKGLPWYHPYVFIVKIIWHKYYYLFISISPIYIIIYDCIFYNFMIIHLYKYLLVFIPLMLWRRITVFIHDESHYLGELLWDIYYKKESCIYAISPNDKKVLEIYLLTNIESNIDLDIEIEWYLRDSLCYEPDPYEKNGYRNNEGSFLERTSDNKVLKEINTGEDFIKEEWILLVEKFHYKNENKYKTLIYIN